MFIDKQNEIPKNNNTLIFILFDFNKLENTLNNKINSGVKTLSGDEPEPFSYRFFVSLLLVPLNCDILSKNNEYRNSDFPPEIFIPR